MGRTEVPGVLVKDADLGRDDLNTTTSGKAVVRKLIQGTGITLSSTGADAGTGDVTVSATGTSTPSLLAANANTYNNSGTGQTDLATYSMPGGTLANTGDTVRITVAGVNSGAGSKTVKVYFGATSITLINGVATASDWAAVVTVTRTGATAQVMVLWGGRGIASTMAAVATPAETLSGAITIKVTGQGGASNEVTQKLMLVEKLAAP